MTTQNLPLVTVYIPTYNRVELLKRAVKSVQEQTYQNFEIIIVDDCSTDSTHEYLENLVKEDSRVRYFLKETNSGACVSRNIAIENARGEFITGLDDDDYFEKNRIEVFLSKWLSCPDKYIALFSEYKNNEKYSFLKSISFYLAKKNIKKRDLYFANYIGNQVFTKTSYLRELNGFDESFKAWQDLDLWFRLSEKGIIRRVKGATYFIDKSHDFSRISNQNVEKIINTKKQFMCKYHISGYIYPKALNNHIFYYDSSKVSILDCLVKVLFNLSDFKGNLIYIFKFIKSRFKK